MVGFDVRARARVLYEKCTIVRLRPIASPKVQAGGAGGDRSPEKATSDLQAQTLPGRAEPGD